MEEENPVQNQIATETIVIEEQPTTSDNPIAGTLILNGEDEDERHVRWTNETIDNENMGKKKSKKSSSSSDSDDDSKPNAYERQPKYKKKNEKKGEKKGGCCHRYH
ncbi:hypothetical protein PIROE2DRAFT_62754 [Piromyces sp. E2]|nr:hypothetical protein PIROE2DRAFT_62754 [Piromyces sp. E2]|eukprot:OUM61048.1 hypothetical protein PIROE2DRAFT_62754 [Piromyces sp. E2]